MMSGQTSSGKTFTASRFVDHALQQIFPNTPPSQVSVNTKHCCGCSIGPVAEAWVQAQPCAAAESALTKRNSLCVSATDQHLVHVGYPAACCINPPVHVSQHCHLDVNWVEVCGCGGLLQRCKQLFMYINQNDSKCLAHASSVNCQLSVHWLAAGSAECQLDPEHGGAARHPVPRLAQPQQPQHLHLPAAPPGPTAAIHCFM